jgi:conjugative transfer signal peptidase TraF
MSRTTKQLERLVAYAALTLIGAGLAAQAAGIRINISASVPLGFYRAVGRAATVGDYVIFCPPPQRAFELARGRGYIRAGLCPGGFGQMVKLIVASAGDSVMITSSGVVVDGRLLPHSKPLVSDLEGRPLPNLIGAQYALSNSQFLLMTDRSDMSFDARYFGPVTSTQVQSVLRPLVIW